MHYIHEPYQPGDTIAAVATPPGEGGVGIIRISGKKAVPIANSIFTGDVPSFATHTAHYGKVLDSNGTPVDAVLLLVMLGKRSYTGEDTVEIHCHGGSLITRRVLDVVIRAGARPAQAGEFTFKAFMNGKIDLAQAEAVQELIGAKNERAVDAAGLQLEGALSQKVRQFQIDLTDTASILEAWVDFPEEGLEFATKDEMIQHLSSVSSRMQQLLDTFHDGKIVHDGICLSLVGAPNVGKSSLMNALLRKERAIVSDIPGTTRDVLEDHMRMNNLNFRIVDTAGIRETEEVIEIEGIKRSHKAMEEADVVILVLDAFKGIQAEDQALLNIVPKDKTIVVWNKTDLPHDALPKLPFQHVATLSAKYQNGLDYLHNEIESIVWKKGPPSKEEVVITNVRHKEALSQSIEACQQVIQQLQNDASPEFIAFEMRQSLTSLGKIIGTNVAEDILSAIFSKFCVGK